jgi:hypothetical protein
MSARQGIVTAIDVCSYRNGVVVRLRRQAFTRTGRLHAVCTLSGAPAWAACDPGEIVIKFSHVTNTDKHPKGIAASLLEQRVNDEMNGKACMEVFPNSTLYDDNKVLEAMLSGDVQLAAPSLSKFEKFTKKFRLFDLPFMFENIEAVDRFQNSADGQKLKDSMKRRGLQGLAFWHNGMKQMSANKPLIASLRRRRPEVPRAGLRRAGRAVRGHRREPAEDVVQGSLRRAAAPASSTVRRTPGRTSTARSSSRCRTALPKPTTASSTTWS